MTPLAPFFDSYYRLRPVNATFTGVHGHDHRLPDWSPDGLAAAVDEMRDLRDRLAGALPPDVQIAEHESLHFQRGNPSLAVGEVAFGAISLMTRPFADVEARAGAAASRLAAAPAFLASACRAMDHGVVDQWRARALGECAGVERLLRDGVARWIAHESISRPLARDLTRAAEQAGAGFDRFRSWLRREVASAPPERGGCGPDLFDLLLARGHWCLRPRRDLATEAAAGLDAALDCLGVRARAVAPAGWPEIQQRLADAHPSAADYLPAYQRIWNDCRERAEARQLVTWPDYPIRYVPIPVHTREAAPFLYYLHYRSPAPFDPLSVHDYVVTPIDGVDSDEQDRRLRAANTSVIKLNHVVHHGAIGHHVQNYYAYRGRSDIGRIAAVDCASRIGMLLGGTMAEGWAS
jgi:hypothetical protein